MKETFITSLADQAGAFLGAVRAITQAGANIHRVSYNKAVDTHMLFLDVEGEEAQLKAFLYPAGPSRRAAAGAGGD